MDYKIKVTQNYNAFTLNEKNRKVDGKHIQKLVKEFKENGYNKAFPIAVIDKGKGIYEIFDGQHRFLAAKQVGCEFSFVVHEKFEADEYIKKLANLNSLSKKWSVLDFIRISENENIRKVAEYVDKNPNYTSFITYYCNVSNRRDLTIENYTPTDIKELDTAIIYLDLLQKYCPNHKKTVAPVIKIIIKNNLDFERLLKNIGKQPVKFVKCATSKQYAEMIEYFYNYDYPKANRVHFDDLE